MEDKIWKSYEQYERYLKILLLLNGTWPIHHARLIYRLIPYVVVIALFGAIYIGLSYAMYNMSTNINKALPGLCHVVATIAHLTKVRQNM